MICKIDWEKHMAMKIGTQLPSLDGATEWINSTQAEAESEAVGHPTLVHFWSVSCDICKENLPFIALLRDRKRDQGMRVIGVHLPRYESDLDVEAVRDLVTRYGMTEPMAVDHNQKLRDAFENDEGYLPAYYLFDAEGKLRGSGMGRRGIEVLRPALERVFRGEDRSSSSESA